MPCHDEKDELAIFEFLIQVDARSEKGRDHPNLNTSRSRGFCKRFRRQSDDGFSGQAG